MNDKKIIKKWWFWVVLVLLILGIFGAFAQLNDNMETDKDEGQKQTIDSSSKLPTLSADDYKGKEGLIVYKELKGKGYGVNAKFENDALTDINGEATSVFEPLDPNNENDRQSVDAFTVSNLSQNGDNIVLTIVKSSN